MPLNIKKPIKAKNTYECCSMLENACTTDTKYIAKGDKLTLTCNFDALVTRAPTDAPTDPVPTDP